MKNKCGGLVIIVSGPSGVGKGTLIGMVSERLSAENINPRFSVSATTRKRSEQEIDGVHYSFVTRERFLDMIDRGQLAEYNEYSGNFYGTPMANLESAIEEKAPIILDIDINGKKQVLEKFDDCTTIFIMPPSVDVLEKRIRGRARDTDTEESIRYRLERASEELAYKSDYKYTIVNDDLRKAADEMYEIIMAVIRQNKKEVRKMKTIDDIFAAADSRYALVDAIAKKAREIADSAELNHVSLNEKPVNMVLRYLFEGKAHVENVSETEVKIIIDEKNATLGF